LINLAHDRDRWRAVVSAVTNRRVLAPRSLLAKRNLQAILPTAVRSTPPAAVMFAGLFSAHDTDVC
jgi:hypothetical protein